MIVVTLCIIYYYYTAFFFFSLSTWKISSQIPLVFKNYFINLCDDLNCMFFLKFTINFQRELTWTLKQPDVYFGPDFCLNSLHVEKDYTVFYLEIKWTDFCLFWWNKDVLQNVVYLQNFWLIFATFIWLFQFVSALLILIAMWDF